MDDRAQRSRRISERLAAFAASWPDTTQVFAYAGFRSEPDVEGLRHLLPGHIRIGLPVVGRDGTMHFRDAERTAGWATFPANSFGIPEPPAGAPELHPLATTLIVVPAVALAADGARLGYGGGFYDRALARFSGAAVGVVFDEFVFDILPTENHDAHLAYGVTELRTILFAPA